MLYFIGGASRAGKTILAQRLLSNQGVRWFGLDALRVGLSRGLPELRFDPELDDLVEADRLWPLVRAMGHSLIDTRQVLCFEGVCLRPSHVSELIAEHPDHVSACFLGYPNISADLKARQVKARCGGTNDWLSDKSEASIQEWVKIGIERSRELEEDCRMNGIAFIDTGARFEQALAEAEEMLFRSALQ